MNNLLQIRLNCLKTCSSLAFLVATVIGTTSSAIAFPVHISLPSRNSQPARTITPPTPPRSLNVSPNPFRQSSSYYRSNADSYYYSDCDRYEGKFVRVRNRRIRNTTLINPIIINSDISDSVIIKPKTKPYNHPEINSSYVRVRIE